ncbi:hypothetical protein NMG60_11018492 [Bertholletia excelsa]
MVLKKRLDYGFNGYRVPVIPRGPRSVRRKSYPKKNTEDNQICAFELLAAVAGKLLQESESSASSNAAEGKDPSGTHSSGIKQEQEEGGKALRLECLDQGSCIESVLAPGLSDQKLDVNSAARKFSSAVCDAVSEHTSTMSSFDTSKKVSHVKLEISGKEIGGLPNSGESCDDYVDNRAKRLLLTERNCNHNVDHSVDTVTSSKDPMEICVNTHPLINSDSSVQMPAYRDGIPNSFFSKHGNKEKVVGRDDDENYAGCNRPSSKTRAFRQQARIRHRRVRKLRTSKYWKAAPKLRDCEFSNTDGGMKLISRRRKALYASERIQCEVPFKKRRLCDHSIMSQYNWEGSSESISNSPEKGMKGDKTSSAVNFTRGSGISASVVGHQASFQSRDPHVKFSIKSFKVPELYIEVPETTTVGSLKRTIMEAVTAILQDGLHVGVLVHGKKVKDDNRTLLQTGISHNDNLDTLNFTLEPSSAMASPPASPKGPHVLLPCEMQQQPTRLPSGLILESGVHKSPPATPPVTDVENNVKGNHELVPSHTDIPIDGTTPDSRALVPMPAVSVEALAVVPLNQKPKRSELVHRRTRRPFSVAEVEALVEAVEKLGTGRWRDVKLCAFENADHRTYVDLKDKWKTLVHTASIAPQQRRGEPVPQELLDRVLSAHAYWSQHQSKQHGKHPADPLIAEAQASRA